MAKDKTVRERIKEVLAEAGDRGLSKSELSRRVGAERGHLRGILNSMMLDGEVMIERDTSASTVVARCILVEAAAHQEEPDRGAH